MKKCNKIIQFIYFIILALIIVWFCFTRNNIFLLFMLVLCAFAGLLIGKIIINAIYSKQDKFKKLNSSFSINTFIMAGSVLALAIGKQIIFPITNRYIEIGNITMFYIVMSITFLLLFTCVYIMINAIKNFIVNMLPENNN